MKVLVSTQKGQGKRKSDFSYVPEGELVKFGYPCDRDRCNIDGVCGCRRSMVGVKTHKATTTFMVAEKECTEQELLLTIMESEKAGGWNTEQAEGKRMVNELLRVASYFPVNTILEKRGNKIKERVVEDGS